MDYIDEIVNRAWARFNRSKLKPILDNLDLKRGGHGFSIGGDSGYIHLRLYNPDIQIREYDHNGKVFVFFGYDDKAGAWGGYTRKYEVTDTGIFKNPRWKTIIKQGGVKTQPDAIMI